MDSHNENKKNNKPIIYEELLQFSEHITNYFAEESKDYLNLINFLNQISSTFKDMSSKIKIPNNFSTDRPDQLNLNSFYNFHKTILEKIKDIPNKINNDILSTLNKFKDEFESDNQNIFFALNTIIEDISTQQNFINKRKDELIKEKEKNKDYIKSLAYELYKKEMETFNKLYSNSENKFKEIKNMLEENEMKKNKIISSCLCIYFSLIYDNLDSMDNQNGDIKKLIKKYKTKENKRKINEIFPNSKILDLKNWGDNFDDWEELKLMESMLVEKKEEKTKETKDEKTPSNPFSNDFYIPQIIITNNIIGIDDEYMVLKSNENNQSSFVDISEDEEKIKDNIIINNFIFGLENSVPKSDLIINIEDVFGRNIGNKEFYIDFCDKIIKAKGEDKTLYEYKIFSNLVYLTNVMNLILEQLKDDLLSDNLNKDYFDSYKLLDKIICIGEKSVNEDTYMCALLSNNKIFKNKKIWINSIRNKIIIFLNELCTKEYLSKSRDSVFHTGDIFHKNFEAKKIKRILSKLGGLIVGREKNLIELCGFKHYIQYYNKLSSEQKKNVDNNTLSIFHGVIKCYIRHITNYNFNVENTTDIISEICHNLKINDDDHIIFYCYYYQDCVYTSKKKNTKNKSQIPLATTQKIKYIKSEKKDKKIPENYILDIKDRNNIYYIIKKVSKYLDDEDKLKLICLGKYYKKIRKHIYKSFLKKDMPIKKRVHIWKSYLKINNTKSLFNYKDILEETKTDFFQKGNEQSIIQINKDINRTYLKKKDEHSADKIYNILISFVYSEHKINYVQGINDITGFIYDLTENEEETFLLLISIFSMTQISDIFNDEEFQFLKTLFYTIERLVYLYLPKIYSKIKDHNIQISFFMSAYFITLDTILYQDLPDDDYSFILRLWDGFILDGWCSFFSDWLAILKYHEKDIIAIESERLLEYLSNKIKNSELFKKENYNKFYELKKQFKISEELVKNLQDEIAVEAGIRKVGTSTIIEGFNDDDKGKDKSQIK